MLTVHSLQISNFHEVMDGNPRGIMVVLHEPGTDVTLVA